jgi:ATP-dependent RNA helicase DDX1
VGKGEKSKARGYSFECAILDKEGTVRVGWATADASLKLGTDKSGWGFGGTGVKVHDNEYLDYPGSGNRACFSQGDIIGCHLKAEVDGGATLSFSRNGEMLGEAFKVVPGDSNMVLYPTMCMKNASSALTFSKSLMFPLPDGFQAVSSAIDVGEAVSNPKHMQLVNVPDSGRKGPIAIVIEPTRDLAEQRLV